MDKTISISLAGHSRQVRLDEPAFERLTRYLDRAAARLADDPHRADVLGDLERSVGDKLDVLLGADDRLVTAAEMDGILDEIGAVETGRDPGPEPSRGRPRKRRLRRIKTGQEVAGVCTGLAAYADLPVDWVRTGFILGSLMTGGILILVYIAMVFILPVAENEAAET